jgi:small GTP-binding protein
MIDKNKLIVNQSLLALLDEKRASNDIDKMIKVCFAGESKVGKTSLINRLKGSEYRDNTIATIGYDFAFVDRDIDGYNIRFQLWDSAGQERYRAISPLHYKSTDRLN